MCSVRLLHQDRRAALKGMLEEIKLRGRVEISMHRSRMNDVQHAQAQGKGK